MLFLVHNKLQKGWGCSGAQLFIEHANFAFRLWEELVCSREGCVLAIYLRDRTTKLRNILLSTGEREELGPTREFPASTRGQELEKSSDG